MKYFGEYLVSKGIVSDEVLVDALLGQIRGLPSVAEIVFEKRAIPPSTMLKAFEIQHEKNVDFRQACRELAVWTDELDAMVSAQVQTQKVPLGQLLVKSGKTDVVTLTKALDEFLAKAELKISAPAQTAAHPVPVPASSPKVVLPLVPEAAEPRVAIKASVPVQPDSASQEGHKGAAPTAEGPGPAPEVTHMGRKLDAILVEEFLGQLPDSKLSKLAEEFKSCVDIVQDSQMQQPFLQDTLVEIHTIRGLLTMVRLEKFDSLFAVLETMMSRFLESSVRGTAVDLQRLSELGASAVAILYELKTVLKESQWDRQWFLVKERGERFSDLFNRLSEACLEQT